MAHCSTNAPDGQGLYVLDARLKALAAGRINWRECRLLALIDQGCNGFKHRRKKNPEPRPQSITRSAADLHRRLGFPPGRPGQEVKRVLDSLVQESLLKVKPVGRGRWKLKTAMIDERVGLLLPPTVEKLFLERRITLGEEFVLAYIISFTRAGKVFYASNRAIGDQFNFNNVSHVIAGLARKGLLLSEITTNAALAKRLAIHAKENGNGYSTYRTTKPCLTARILWPTFEGAYNSKTEWAIAPEDIDIPEYHDRDDEW